jgi:hypothetical protein
VQRSRKICNAFTVIFSGLVLLLPISVFGTEQTCETPRLKPFHHLSGIVQNQAREYVANATVTILRGNTAQTAAKTDENGRFSFDESNAGNYEIRVEANDHLSVQFPIAVKKPRPQDHRILEITLSTGYPNYSMSVRIMKR